MPQRETTPVSAHARPKTDAVRVAQKGPNTVQPKGELMSLVQELGLEKNMLLADPMWFVIVKGPGPARLT